MQWLHRIFHREIPHIPEALWQAAVAQLPFLQRLAPPDLARLKQLSQTLLGKTTFTGAGGLDLTDQIAVMIAAQACLPVLNLTLELYRDMAGVIVYPAAFIVPHTEMDEAGVVHEWHEPIAGEALDAGGAVVLSWEDAAAPHAPGGNVVIHEFAHKIDMGDGSANGCPPFLAAFHGNIARADWQVTFRAAYADFCARVAALESCLPHDFDDGNAAHVDTYEALSAGLPLDPYAAINPAEFFAVASETFFVLPQPLADIYPQVYHLLARYYRQDPLHS